MKILFASYEAAPFFQTGGLGDVAHSLPYALAKLGIQTTLVLPKYRFLSLPNKVELIFNFEIGFDNKKEKIEIYKMPVTKDISLDLISHPYLLDPRKGGDRVLKFALFSKAIATMIVYDKKIFGDFDIIHLNDLHSASVAFFLANWKIHPYPPTILTIHNLLYQGTVKCQKLSEALGMNIEGKNSVSLLQLGIVCANHITTVSPSYAKEIVQTKLGFNLRPLLHLRKKSISGILNGIDYQIWDPAKDHFIPQKFSAETVDQDKSPNKLALQKELKLPISELTPLVSFVGRLEPNQKGIDLIYRVLESQLKEKTFQFILLGTGNRSWAKKISSLVASYPKRMVFINKFDQASAHKVYAASDIILIPSKFEPCGLVQMIAMRYGTLPLVRKTGGLADTVRDGENGFVFDKYSATALTRTFRLALKLFRDNPEKIAKMRQTAMHEDFSWVKSAREYKKLYRRVIREKAKTKI